MPTYSTHFPIGVTADAIAVLQSQSGGPLGGAGGLEDYDTYDGFFLWSGPAPQHDGRNALASVSRYGTYMSTYIGSMYNSQLSVETYDGRPVTTSPFSLTATYVTTGFNEWVSDGTMLICDGVANAAVYRWDIFSTPKLLYTTAAARPPRARAASALRPAGKLGVR